MKDNNNPLLFSLLVSMNKKEEHEITLEDLRYIYSPKVSRCQIRIYTLVIEALSNGMSYEEIHKMIDKIDFEEYKSLGEDEKRYIRMRVKRDVNSRKNNELKNRGVIDNE